ncbi:HlyC/CorC family transporter [Bacillus megaterium]|nr:HlyC/CorC family transporter [Priestia megaterium]
MKSKIMVNPYGIIGLILLIMATAYFVARRICFCRVRSSRIDQLAQEGNKKAVNVQKILNNLDGYLSACQLGITITSLGLGWLGEPTIQTIFSPLLTKLPLGDSLLHALSFIIAFAVVTFLHVVIGELSPKSIAIQKAEWVCLTLSSSIIAFYKIMYPFIWMLNGSANLVIKAMGMKSASEHSEEHSEEEIKLIVSTSNDINSDEKTMVEKIFEFDETITREVMVHRKDMNCIYLKNPIEVTLEYVGNNAYTRYPVVGEDKDDVKGYINIRDLYTNASKGKGLDGIVRDIPKVYESTPIKKC